MNLIYDFSGKVAVVTGSAGGLGKAIAMKFAKAGANVVICDVKDEMAKETLKEIEELGGKAIYCYTDITSEESIEKMKEETIDNFGTIDILINCAGISAGPGIFGPPLTKLPIDEFKKLHNVNTLGMVRVTQAFYDIFIGKKEGKIVNIASISAYSPSPLQPHYSMSKIAAINFTQGLSIELGPYNINVNCVNPGFVYTPMYGRALEWKELRPEQFKECSTHEDVMNQMANNMSAMKRAQKPEDIADTVMFLSSDGAKEITGQVINVDSGIIRR